jgi:hypothetical protein
VGLLPMLPLFSFRFSLSSASTGSAGGPEVNFRARESCSCVVEVAFVLDFVDYPRRRRTS